MATAIGLARAETALPSDSSSLMEAAIKSILPAHWQLIPSGHYPDFYSCWAIGTNEQFEIWWDRDGVGTTNRAGVEAIWFCVATNGPVRWTNPFTMPGFIYQNDPTFVYAKEATYIDETNSRAAYLKLATKTMNIGGVRSWSKWTIDAKLAMETAYEGQPRMGPSLLEAKYGSSADNPWRGYPPPKLIKKSQDGSHTTWIQEAGE